MHPLDWDLGKNFQPVKAQVARAQDRAHHIGKGFRRKALRGNRPDLPNHLLGHWILGEQQGHVVDARSRVAAGKQDGL